MVGKCFKCCQVSTWKDLLYQEPWWGAGAGAAPCLASWGLMLNLLGHHARWKPNTMTFTVRPQLLWASPDRAISNSPPTLWSSCQAESHRVRDSTWPVCGTLVRAVAGGGREKPQEAATPLSGKFLTRGDLSLTLGPELSWLPGCLAELLLQEAHRGVCVCVCVCVRARARVCGRDRKHTRRW